MKTQNTLKALSKIRHRNDLVTGLTAFLFATFLAALLATTTVFAADEDEARESYRRAREALNESEYERAAELYAESRELAESDDLAGNSLYWEAFARYRQGRTEELRVALELLYQQAELYHQVETLEEAEALAARINGELARRGEVDALRETHQRASGEDEREATRVAALEALMHMDPERAKPILKKILLDGTETNSELRRNAVFIMCQMDDEESEQILIDLLQTESDDQFKAEIIMCLVRFESDRSIDAIIAVFEENPDSEMGEAALMVLGHRGGDRVFDFLLRLAKDERRDPEVRAHALMGLSRTGRDDEVAELLTQIIRTEKNREILEMALHAMSRLEGDLPDSVFRDLINNKQVDDELRAQALFMASRRGELDLEFLRQVYRDAEDRELKLQTYHVLSRHDDQDAALDLMIELIKEEEDAEIRREAVFWISRFDNDRAAEYLLELINQK